MTDNKIERGQFYTMTNPFMHSAVCSWLDEVKRKTDPSAPWVEPFAGANNIVEMIDSLGIRTSGNWMCFDIEPCSQQENTSGVPVHQRDTLADYPKGYPVGISNPPYLAKNSATRRGLPFPDTKHDDLYKYALDMMLANHEFVAVIIPESFLTSGLFRKRLHTVISLPIRMFEDTEVPVCLSLFVPEHDGDFVVYSDKSEVGLFRVLEKHNQIIRSDAPMPFVFNDPAGAVGLRAIDSVSGPSIEFVPGETFDSADISSSNRSFTRIGISLPGVTSAALVAEANAVLHQWRHATSDVFLTSFKGLRKDGKYRRRLDWKSAKAILDTAYANLLIG